MRFVVFGSTIVTCWPPCLTITSMFGIVGLDDQFAGWRPDAQ